MADLRKLTNVQNNVIHVCVLLREGEGISRYRIADRLGKHVSHVSRWETGRWVDYADELIDAYAELCGLDNAGTIWRRAVRFWNQPMPGSPKATVQMFGADARSALDHAGSTASRDGRG